MSDSFVWRRYVDVGDQVEEFQNVCLVESDKASVAITSRCAHTITTLVEATPTQSAFTEETHTDTHTDTHADRQTHTHTQNTHIFFNNRDVRAHALLQICRQDCEEAL